MKRNLLICALAFFALTGCEKESSPSPDSGSGLPDCKLISLSQENSFRSYTFEYDSTGRLVKENEKWNGTLRLWSVMRYENGQLVAREHWTNYPSQSVALASYDTLIYNGLGQIEEKRVYHGPDAPDPHLVYFYEYDTEGFPVKSRLFYPAGNEYWSSRKYFWENGNLTKIEDYGGNFQGLEHEWFYEYGKALNYQKQLAMFPEHPEYQSVNMVSKMKANDYTGLLDFICNPCHHKYEVNSDGLPKVIKYGWDENKTYLDWDCG